MRKLIDQIKKEELEYCKNHILYFIEQYCKIEDKDAVGLMIPFTLWEGQKNAIQSFQDNRFNIVLKARQLGITWLVLADALHTLMFKEGSTVVALSRTETEAQELVRRIGAMCMEMREFISPEKGNLYTLSIKKMSLSLKAQDGRERIFKAFTSNPAAARSFTANLIIFDEWAYQRNAEEIWISGLPTVNRPEGGRVIGLSTMQCGTLFEEIWKNSSMLNKVFLPWNTDPRRDRDWYETTYRLMGEDMLREYPSTPEEAMTAPGGAFFSEFRRYIHVCEPFAIPSHWRRYHAIDYGLDMLASLWAVVDPEGNVFVYREVYESGLIIPQACRVMQEAEGEEPIYARFAPPDLFGKSSETGRTRIETFEEGGFSFERASADRKAGWSNLKDWLQVQKGENGSPTARLQIFSCCENLIRTLMYIPRDKKSPDDCATEPHELTHAPDALRYLMMSRPAAQQDIHLPTRLWYEEAENLLEYR